MLVEFFVYLLLYGAFGVIENHVARRVLSLDKKALPLLHLGLGFRIILTYFYYYYFKDQSADAIRYFGLAAGSQFSLTGLVSPGSTFIINLAALIYPFSAVFPNSYLMLYVPFGLIGHTGSIFLYATACHFSGIKPYSKSLVAFFLPNLIFWTSNIGKDSVIFMGLMCFTYGLVCLPRLIPRLALMSFGLFVVFLTRPHVAAFLFVSLLSGIILRFGRVNLRAGLILILTLIAFLATYSSIFEYVGLKVEIDESDESVTTITDLYQKSVENMESRAKTLNYGGSSMGVAPISIIKAPFYFVTFIGGPFLWDARKPIQIAAAIEAVIYQIVMVFVLLNWKYFKRYEELEFKYTWVIFMILASVMLGMAYSNFGLTVRQKCMVIPFLMIIFLSTKSQKVKENERAVDPEIDL